MVKRLLLTGLVGASMMGVVGCGGGSGDSLPAPTGKIAKSDANELQRLVSSTGLDPFEMLKRGAAGGSSARSAKIVSESLKNVEASGGGSEIETWEGEHECAFSGTYTNKIISGISPYDNHEVNASKLVYEYITKDCRYYEGGISQTGTKKGTWDWKRKDNTWTNNWSGSTESYVYMLDDTHKFTTSSASWSGKTAKEHDDMGYPIKEENSKHYVRSGILMDGNTTYEFKNITRDKTTTQDRHEMTYSKKWELSGAIKSDEFDGWIVIGTPVVFERNQDDAVTEGEVTWYCNHKGKMTISGKEHTVTKEVYVDHKIDVKYDDEVIKSYANCIKYHQDQ